MEQEEVGEEEGKRAEEKFETLKEQDVEDQQTEEKKRGLSSEQTLDRRSKASRTQILVKNCKYACRTNVGREEIMTIFF